MTPFGRRPGSDAILGEAVSRLREALGAGGTLSPTSRERILSRAVREGASPGSASTRRLAPAFRLVLAASIPAALVGAALLSVTFRSGAPRRAEPAGILRAEKVGDQVVFTIANGNRPHVVYRSTDPARFDRVSAERVVGGRFEDRMTEQPGIVFYRVE